eukprot:356803-Chlamydomonas_euryale.AAC.1
MHPHMVPKHARTRAPTLALAQVYAAPEYVKSMSCRSLADLGPASDVFSFAKIMYEVLSNCLINPAEVEGENEGWHTTSDTLSGYAIKVRGSCCEATAAVVLGPGLAGLREM